MSCHLAEAERAFRRRHGVLDISAWPSSADERDVWIATDVTTGYQVAYRAPRSMPGTAVTRLAQHVTERAAHAAAERSLTGTVSCTIDVQLWEEVASTTGLTLHRRGDPCRHTCTATWYSTLSVSAPMVVASVEAT